jgi:hypothetical protein
MTYERQVQTMRSIFKVAVAAILLLMAGRVSMAQADTDDAPHAPPVSIVTLLAQPASHNAQRVQVSGFLVLDFEGHMSPD